MRGSFGSPRVHPQARPNQPCSGVPGRWLEIAPPETGIGPLPRLNLKGIDWVIVGGESGASPRPMSAEWVLEIRDQCERHDVAFFFKQWGGRNKKAAGRSLEGVRHDTFPKPKKRRQVRQTA